MLKKNTANFTYLGDLRCEAEHIRSGEKFVTDAPVDNNGKGEAFSPTDLIGASLVTCMITVMGIRAEKQGMKMGKVTGTVKKTMIPAPRRVGQLDVVIKLEGHSLSIVEKKQLEQVAINCPVALSLSPEIVQKVKFEYA